MFVIAGLSLVLAVSSLAAWFGAYWWPLDLLANFRVQMAAGLVVSVILLAMARWRRTVRVVGLVMAVNLLVVGWTWLPGGPDVTDGDALRILSFNVLAANERYEDVMAYVDQVDADLVFIHESSLPWEEAADDADLGYRIIKTRDDDHIFGTLVMVRGPAEVESFGFTEREPRSVEVVMTLQSGREVSVLGIHPVAPVTETASGLRDAQMAFAANWAEERDTPVVVAGDFNSTPWSHAFRRLVAEGDLRDSQRGFGVQPSFPASSNLVFRIPIDNVLVSDQIEVVDRHLGPALGSDHFPVVVDLLVD